MTKRFADTDNFIEDSYNLANIAGRIVCLKLVRYCKSQTLFDSNSNEDFYVNEHVDNGSTKQRFFFKGKGKRIGF